MLYRHPGDLHALLGITADATTNYLLAQHAAGAQALMIFDTWGGMLSSAAYREFSLAYIERIVQALKTAADDLPVIVFTKGGCQWLEEMAETGCDALGLDWTCDLGGARHRVGARVALQGNLDPGVLYGDDDTVRREVAAALASFGHGSGHVFNLGHGIHPGVDPARVATLVNAVHELSPAYHA
jgi:uroporphyrinogen decarboxylase